MRFGICAGSTDKETLGYIKSLGYDYIEGNFGNVQGMDESALREYISVTRDLDIAVEAYCIFLKGDFRVVGPNTNHGDICEYAKIGFEKAARLGGKTVVFGSGGARRIPEDMNRDAAYDELAWFLSMCGDLGVHYGVIVAIEPLNQKECNVLNTVAETSAMLRRVKRVGLRFVADSYHMECENEDLSVLEENRDFLSHVHIAASTARRYPGTVDAPYLSAFAEKLHGIGYTGRVTVEAHTSDYANELKTAAAYARAKF